MIGSLVARLRRPEYTGENRCLPCTILNVGIASAGATLVGAWLVAAGYPTAALGAATILLVVSLIAIWLRGYLVPGTPTLTKRYLPASILSLFGKTPEASPEGFAADEGATEGEATDAPAESAALDTEALLERADAIEPCRGDDRCLTEAFGEAWHEEMQTVQEAENLTPWLTQFDIEGEEIVTREVGNAFAVSVDGRRTGSWESESAFEADLAAASVLADRLLEWESLDARERGQVCNGLRIFLETCPGCGGPVSFGTETVESCCTSRTVAAVTCDDCGDRVFESPVDEDQVAA